MQAMEVGEHFHVEHAYATQWQTLFKNEVLLSSPMNNIFKEDPDFVFNIFTERHRSDLIKYF